MNDSNERVSVWMYNNEPVHTGNFVIGYIWKGRIALGSDVLDQFSVIPNWVGGEVIGKTS